MATGDTDNLYHFDLIILGAGPAGCACALNLAGSGLKVAILEKSRFPRDKICGDALSPDVLNQLEHLQGDLKSEFLKRYPGKKQHIRGVKLTGTKNNVARIDLLDPDKHHGWVVKRIHFDTFLFEQITGLPGLQIFQDTRIEKVSDCGDYIELESGNRKFHCKLLVGADGAQSVISRQLAGHQIERKHHSAALRGYFSNVEGMNGSDAIELHFYKRSLPGYFWIFPLPNNQANVGLGMLTSRISKRNINLRELFHELIESEPALRGRFEMATMESGLQGFSLPLGSRKRKLSGNRFMLTGDAAALIDPITGEGVANAIRSGRYAAEHAIECFGRNDFSANATARYERYLYSKVWDEMRFSRFLMITLRYPLLLNLLLKAISRKKGVKRFLNQLICDAGFWANGFRPGRYMKNWRESREKVIK